MKFLSTLAIAVGLSALCCGGRLNAMDIVCRNLHVPFAFKVDTATLPAGEYRIEREIGKQAVYIVNVKTGRRVQMISLSPLGETGKVKLTFQTTTDGYKLAKIS